MLTGEQCEERGSGGCSADEMRQLADHGICRLNRDSFLKIGRVMARHRGKVSQA